MRALASSLVFGVWLLAACGDDDASSSSGTGAGATTGAGAGATTGSGTTTGTGNTSTGSGNTGGGGSGVGGGPPQGTPMLVAVGYGGRRLSSLDGLVWENDIIVDPNGGDDNNLFRGVGFGDGVFVAVGGGSEGQVATSTDGVSWTFQSPATSWIGDVAFLGGVFVAAGGNGLRIRSTDGGVTWTDDQGYYSGHYRGIAAGNGVFVAAGHTYGGGDQGLTSTTTDGVTWTAEQTGGATFHSITYGAGAFVAVGNDRCSVSSDGATWSDCAITATDLGHVVFGDGLFALRAAEGIFTSADGMTWQSVAAQQPPQGILGFGLGTWVGASWPGHLFGSADLLGWQTATVDDGPAIVDVQLGFVD